MPNEEEKCKLIEYIDDYKQSVAYKNKEKKEYEDYKFIPLKNKYGFIVYSKKEYDKYDKINNLYSDYKNIEEKYLHRFYYYIQLQNNNSPNEKILTIIMLNPAFACSQKEDSTIKNIESILKENREYDSFEIINLYSVRMPKPKNVEELLKSVGNTENLKFIKQYIKNTRNNILLAYGNIYSLRINVIGNFTEFLKELSNKENLYAIRINNSDTPMHPSQRNNRYLNDFKNLITISLKQDTFKVEEKSQK